LRQEKLRKNHYHGLPFKVTNYFEFIARETRELMAQLGVKRLVDLIGRTDLLKELEGFTAKQQKLELSSCWKPRAASGKAVYCTENNPPFDNGVLNAQLLQQAKPYVTSRAKRSGLISATPTVPVPRSPATSRRRTATRGWQPIRLPRTSAVPRVRASACGTQAALSCT
jgi:hypothetical protein